MPITPTTLPTVIVANETTGEVADTIAAYAAINAVTAELALPKSASDLSTGTLAASRIAVGSVPLDRLAAPVATAPALAAVEAKADAALAAAGTTPAAPRESTSSTTLTLTDSENIVRMRNTAAATVTVPLGSNAGRFRDGALIGVDRFAGDVTIAPYAANTTLQRLITPAGLKARAVGSAITIEAVRRSAPTRPAGFWATVSGAQFDATANGTVIDSVSPDATSSVTLPAITPTGTQRPTVARNAVNGRTGLSFNGTSNTLPLSGAWLGLLANRPDAMILVTYLVTAPGISGERMLVQFSTGASSSTARAFIKWRDNGTGQGTVAGRRLDADATAVAVSTGAATSPDLAVIGGRFVWSSSDLYGLRNNAQAGSQLTFQTDGSTSNTASVAASIGSNSTGTGEFFNGVILDVSIGPDDATLRTAYQSWAELYYGEEALVSGDTVA